MAVPLDAGSVEGVFMVVADCFLDVAGRTWPVELTSYSVLHGTLGGVSLQFLNNAPSRGGNAERDLYHCS